MFLFRNKSYSSELSKTPFFYNSDLDNQSTIMYTMFLRSTLSHAQLYKQSTDHIEVSKKKV